MFRLFQFPFFHFLWVVAIVTFLLTVPCAANELGPPVSPCSFAHTHEEYVVNAKAMVDTGADLHEVLDRLACIGKTKNRPGLGVDTQSAAIRAWFALAPSDEQRRRQLLAIVEDPETSYGPFMLAGGLLVCVADDQVRRVMIDQLRQSLPFDESVHASFRLYLCLDFLLEDGDPRAVTWVEKLRSLLRPAHPMQDFFESGLRRLRLGNRKSDLLGLIESAGNDGLRPWAIRRALRLADDPEEIRNAVRRWMAEEAKRSTTLFGVAEVVAETDLFWLFGRDEGGIVRTCRDMISMTADLPATGPKTSVPWADEIIRAKRAEFYRTAPK